MKKGNYLLLFVTLFLLFGGAREASAQLTKYGQAGMPFLKIEVGARSAAMASTQVGVTGSAEAMFSNPAGMAFVEGLDVVSSVNDWIADINHYGAGLAYRVGNIGTFGASIVWMDYGEFRRTAPALPGDSRDLRNQGYIDQGTFSVSEYAVGISYARQIAGQFYVGGQLKYARQDLGSVEIFDQFTGENSTIGNNVSNVVFDFGTLYYTGFRDLRFGMSIRNFSNQSDYFDQRFELPLSLDFGIAMNVLSLWNAPGTAEQSQSNNVLTLAVDYFNPRDNAERLHTGLEYGFMDTFFLRGGYKFNYDEQGLTAGLGINAALGDLGLRGDYAYSAFGGFFGAVHRVTVGFSL